jgi:serine/threonine protein phosphatase PrpC
MHAGLSTPLDPRNGRAAPLARAPSVGSQHATIAWRSVQIEVAVASGCGFNRLANEDAHTPLDVAGPPFVVADGVGGGALAGLVSRWLVAELQVLLQHLPPDASLAGAAIQRAMLDADAALARRIADYTDAPGAATVALCAPLDAHAARWIVGWVGDCRLHRWQPAARRLALLSADDTFRRLQETPPPGSSPDDPARMVGNGATTGASVAEHILGDDELLVLCSDGVHRHVGAAEWEAILAQPCDLRVRCEALVHAARANGSTDDATVLLVRVAPSAPGRGTRSVRARADRNAST